MKVPYICSQIRNGAEERSERQNMKEQELKKLLCLTPEEEQYLTEKFQIADEHTAAELEFEPFFHNRQMIAVRLLDAEAGIPTHKHKYIEMFYAYSGSITHQINGTEITLNEGDLLFMNQYVEHGRPPGEKGNLGIVFIIRPEFFDIPLQMISEENEIRAFLVNSLRQNNPVSQYLLLHTNGLRLIHNLVDNLLQISCEKPGNALALYQYTMGLIFLHLTDSSHCISSNFFHGYRDTIIRETLSCIDSHYSTVTLSQLADDFHQPLSTMSKIIKEETGHTFRELLMKKRFQMAVQLLLETDLRVEEIAIYVGYENLSYFYRQFKKRCKMTPRQYRLIHKNGFFRRA